MAAPSIRSRLALLLPLLLVVVAVLAFYLARWPLYGGRIGAVQIDLAQPQGYIASPALSRLPRDLVRAPLLRDVLTEDFVFYYDDHETRLSLAGALRRLAFEHPLPLSEHVLAQVLDEPAELGWWLDAKGAPRHWALLVRRGALAKALHAAAKVAGRAVAADEVPLLPGASPAGSAAGRDRQLRLIGTARIAGDDVPVLALQLSTRQTLALLAHGERLLVLSDPGLLFGTTAHGERMIDARGQQTAALLLMEGASRWQQALGLDAPAPRAHRLAASAELLARGWPHFMPGLRGLRAEVALDAPAGAVPQLALRLAESARPALTQASVDDTSPAAIDAALWAALPQDAAACARLPVDWGRVAAVREQDAALRELAARLQGPAAVCWSARSQLHTPLFVARLADTPGDAPASDAALAALWAWALRGAVTEPAAPATPADRVLQHPIGDAPWGLALGTQAGSTYQPTLRRHGRWLVFSPDAEWAERAAQTLAQQRPALRLPAGTVAYVAPGELATLARREALAVLPASEGALRQAAETLLWPRLDALARHPAAALVVQGRAGANDWVPVAFVPLAAGAASSAAPAASAVTP